MNRRRAVHVGLDVFGVINGVGQNTVVKTPVEKVALADCAFTRSDTVNKNFDARPASKGVEVAAAKMCERNFVSVIDVEQAIASRLADDVVFLGIVGDKPVERSQRDARLLVDEGHENVSNHALSKKRLNSLQNADLSLREIVELKRTENCVVLFHIKVLICAPDCRVSAVDARSRGFGSNVHVLRIYGDTSGERQD